MKTCSHIAEKIGTWSKKNISKLGTPANPKKTQNNNKKAIRKNVAFLHATTVAENFRVKSKIESNILKTLQNSWNNPWIKHDAIRKDQCSWNTLKVWIIPQPTANYSISEPPIPSHYSRSLLASPCRSSLPCASLLPRCMFALPDFLYMFLPYLSLVTLSFEWQGFFWPWICMGVPLSWCWQGHFPPEQRR